MPDRAWKLLQSRQIAAYRAFRLRADRYRFEPTQDEAEFVVCETGDWVLVIPVTPEKEVVFVRQYRHGVREVVLEVPGGLLEPGESAEAAATRELAEETGYVPQRVELVGTLQPNPAQYSARFHVVLAEGCHSAGPPQPDSMERIDVGLRPLADVPEMIRSGELRHALVVAAFGLWQYQTRAW